MGGLFSRAFKRITQGNQQRSRSDTQADQQIDSTKDAKRPTRSLVESIPVGQSIDSAEYRALEGNKNVLSLPTSPVSGDDQKENKFSIKKEEEKIRDVEEAVVKIQALVRGHLTRKALKDANQPSNELGQSQFDEDSLTKNLGELNHQHQTPATGGINVDGRAPLESIAEVNETTAASIGASVKQTADELAEMISKQAKQEAEEAIKGENDAGRQRWIPKESGGSPSANRESLDESRDGGVSPVASEANASIDLSTCDTPASASIDILDHNIRPTDRLASVLHPNQQQQQQRANSGEPNVFVEITSSPAMAAGGDGATGEISTPENEEAAAVRIQSAFRGYRTRKNSPYRTRSPNSSVSNNKRDAVLRQQEAVDASCDEPSQGALVEAEAEELEAQQRVADEGRRESRSKLKDPNLGSIARGAEADADADADAASTEEDTVKEVRLHLDRHQDGTADEDPSCTTSLSAAPNNTMDEDDEQPVSSSLINSAALELAQSQQSHEDDRHQSHVDQGATKWNNETSYDTDSSILGAALSMNEEVSSGGLDKQQTTLTGEGDATELESEALRLVEELRDEMELKDHDRSAADDLDEATNQLEATLEETLGSDSSPDPDQNQDPNPNLNQSPNPDPNRGKSEGGESFADDGQSGSGPINAEEQLAIELESDDIERRDPRGQASEERARSPQISTDEMEPIELVLDRPQDHHDDDGDGRPDKLATDVDGGENKADEASSSPPLGQLLMAKNSPDLETTPSGRSSPAIDNSSNGDDSDFQVEDNQNNRNKQEQQQSSKSKKRNRNKKRGKK